MNSDPLLLIKDYLDRFVGSTAEQIVLEACRSEIIELRSIISNIKEGFEGCCHTCEPVGCLNKKLEEQIETLENRCDHLETDRNNLALSLEAMECERDEARRLFCKCHAQAEAAGYAEGRGWDCFKNKKATL
jgi:chromosome segregation ATPase